jgi:uncharacterized membrane protein YhhN
MLTFRNNWTLLYFLVVVLSIVLLLNGCELAFMLVKPWILPVLMIFIFIQYKTYDHTLISFLLVATFFSILGDIFLIIPLEKTLFTSLALCTFIVAQVCYGMLFYLSTTSRQPKEGYKGTIIPESILAIVIFISLIFVFPHLGNFAFPVLVYSFFNSFSIFFALKRRKYVQSLSFITVMTGLVGFYVSDILTALDLTLQDKVFHAGIIASYSIGHFLVIKGMMLQIQTEIEQKEIGT